MKIIKKLSQMISEEIEDANKYINCALKYKAEYPNLAQVFYNLSTEEMGHQNILHNEVVKMINDYRAIHGEPPKEMMALYDYLHEQQIENARVVKSLQSIYTES